MLYIIPGILKTMALHIVDHPLLIDRISRLRDKNTSKILFISYLDQASSILAVFSTKNLALQPIKVETPLETTSCYVLRQKIILIPILRAGLGMLKSFQFLLPEAQVFLLGATRDEKTFHTTLYHGHVPNIDEHHQLFLLDPMLATGSTLKKAVEFLKAKGAMSIRVVCCIASPEGIKQLCQSHEEIEIFTGCVDREVDSQGFILPGLGDAGDRLFGHADNNFEFLP